jgi:hypothetical protein
MRITRQEVYNTRLYLQTLEKQEQVKEEVYRKQIEKRNFDQIIAERVARNIRLDLAKGTHVDIEC